MAGLNAFDYVDSDQEDFSWLVDEEDKEESDEEYGVKSKKKKKKKTKAKKSKPKEKKNTENATSEAMQVDNVESSDTTSTTPHVTTSIAIEPVSTEDVSTSSPTNPTDTATTTEQKDEKPRNNRKRKYKEISDPKSSKESSVPTKKRKVKRGWTDEEEFKYREALELFGRDWKKVSAHIGTREPSAVRSHTQVHFLRLLKESIPLPAKVLESGNGYTLSGKPLNKYSSSVLRIFKSADEVPMVDGVISDEEGAMKLRQKDKDGNPKPRAERKKREPKKPASAKKKKKKKRGNDSESEDEYCPTGGFKSYRNANINPEEVRRSSRAKRGVATYSGMVRGEDLAEDPFNLRSDMERYKVIPHTDEQSMAKKLKNDRIQPFEIRWCPNALLVADFHTHLCQECEVMGLLAGTFDNEKKMAYISKCYPLKEDTQSDREVMADPIDQIHVTQLIENEGLMVLGWYHSHPSFENYPSNRDLEQHSSHKEQCEHSEMDQPYIGLIVASWSSLTEVSEFRWFNSIRESDGETIPMQFEAWPEQRIALDDPCLLQQMEELVSRYGSKRYDDMRSNLSNFWLPNLKRNDENNPKKMNGAHKQSKKEANGNTNTNARNRGEKLMTSLKGHAKEAALYSDMDESVTEAKAQIFVGKIMQMLRQKQDIWWKASDRELKTQSEDIEDEIVSQVKSVGIEIIEEA